MKRRPHPFKTEAELCAAFIAWAKPQGFVAYAETAGWDVLLVAADGTQIGVQAKLVFNMAVLSQAVPDWMEAYAETGPDFRAVLVPRGSGGDRLCGLLGITEFTYRGDSERITAHIGPYGGAFSPDLGRPYGGTGRWHYWNPAKRHALPKYVPDVAAGSAAPVQLTRWKIGALEIAATCELRGYVTRVDFRKCSVDPRRWIAEGWVRAGDKPGEFVVVGNSWQKQHPAVYPQVLADVREALAATGELVLTADEPTR